MSKITRQGSNAILSTSVEYHNFVYLAGITADDLSKDITGQTEEVIAKINAALENNGTDKTRLLTAQIWLKHITDRDTMNKVWVKWLRRRRPPGARLRAGRDGRSAPSGRDHDHRLPLIATAERVRGRPGSSSARPIPWRTGSPSSPAGVAFLPPHCCMTCDRSGP